MSAAISSTAVVYLTVAVILFFIAAITVVHLFVLNVLI